MNKWKAFRLRGFISLDSGVLCPLDLGVSYFRLRGFISLDSGVSYFRLRGFIL